MADESSTKNFIDAEISDAAPITIPNSQGYGWVPPSQCCGSIAWVPASGGSVPPGATRAGFDQDGGPIYVGRAFHDGDILPCKICPSHGCAYVAYGGCEVSKPDYEVLVSEHIAWKPAAHGDVPPEAVKIGQTSDGEPLYAGRVMHEGTQTPGKVHPSHRCIYISWAGGEISFPEYEVMILL